MPATAALGLSDDSHFSPIPHGLGEIGEGPFDIRTNTYGNPYPPAGSIPTVCLNEYGRRQTVPFGLRPMFLLLSRSVTNYCQETLVLLIPECPDVVPGISRDSRHKRLISFIFHGSTGDGRLHLDPRCRCGRKDRDKPSPGLFLSCRSWNRRHGCAGEFRGNRPEDRLKAVRSMERGRLCRPHYLSKDHGPAVVIRRRLAALA